MRKSTCSPSLDLLLRRNNLGECPEFLDTVDLSMTPSLSMVSLLNMLNGNISSRQANKGGRQV